MQGNAVGCCQMCGGIQCRQPTQPLGVPQSCSPLLALDPCYPSPACHLNRFPCNPDLCKNYTTKVLIAHFDPVTYWACLWYVCQFWDRINPKIPQSCACCISLISNILMFVCVFAFVFVSIYICICIYICVGKLHRDLDEVIAAITRHLRLGHLYRSRHRNNLLPLSLYLFSGLYLHLHLHISIWQACVKISLSLLLVHIVGGSFCVQVMTTVESIKFDKLASVR